MEKHILQNLSDTYLFQNVNSDVFDSDKVIGELLTVTEGQIIYHENSHTEAIYLVISGEVDVLVKNKVNRKISKRVSDGSFFGQHEYLKKSNRLSTAVVLKDSYLIKIKTEVLDYLGGVDNLINENLHSYDNLKTDDLDNNKKVEKDQSGINVIETVEKSSEQEDNNYNDGNELQENTTSQAESKIEVEDIFGDIEDDSQMEKSSLNIDEKLIYDEINKVGLGESEIESGTEYYNKYETTEEFPIPTPEIEDYLSSDAIIVEDPDKENCETQVEPVELEEEKHDIQIDLEAEYSKLVLEHASKILYPSDLHELEKNIINSAKEITEARVGKLYKINHESGLIKYCCDDNDDLTTITIDESDDIIKWLLENKTPLLFQEDGTVEADHEILNIEFDSPDESVLYFPFLNEDNNCNAIIELRDKHEGSFVTEDELKLFLLGKIVIPKIKTTTEKTSDNDTKENITFQKFAQFLKKEIKKPILISKRYAEHLNSKDLSDDAKKVLLMLNNQISDVTELVTTTTSLVDSSVIARPVTVNINSILEDFSNKVKTYLNENNASIENKFDDDTFVKLDIKLFYQCYSEIIKNAVEALDDGGIINITTEKSEDCLTILFNDEGTGIPSESIAKIFDPFYSIDKPEHAGLGLTFTNLILIEMNSEICITSTPSIGTEIKIVFPIVKTSY